MKQIRVPPVLKRMFPIFDQNGFEAYLVGGAIRDILLGKGASDWDLATNANPDDVMRIFKRVIPTGIEHGTVTVLFEGQKIEVTTYRIDTGYSDGRHPDAIRYAGAIEEDLSRRDFTMNAIAASLRDGRLVDPFDGQVDIKKRLIKTVGIAGERFTEDGLRPVRAVRFAAQLEFELTDETLAAIPRALPVTAKIALERFRDELCKMLTAKQPSVSLRLMETTGLLDLFIPELSACRNVEQKGFHRFDVLDHLFFACDASPANNLTVRLAALFHDIGKPAAREESDEKTTFYGHEDVGARITAKVLERLRFSRQMTQAVTHLVAQHMFHYEDHWTDAAVRRFLIRVKADGDGTPLESWKESCVLSDLFDLRLADVNAIAGFPALPQGLEAFQDRIDSILSQKSALGLKSLAVNGSDLLSLGFTGKEVGYTLSQLLEAVLDDPSMNTREALLTVALRIKNTIGT